MNATPSRAPAAQARLAPPLAVLLASLLAACGGGAGTGGTGGTAAPPPAIAAVTPAVGSPLGGALVTIAGADFGAAPTVTFGAAAATLVGATSTTLTVTAPAHAAGAVGVTVINPDGQRMTLTSAFTFQAPPPPVLTGLSATVGALAGGDRVTLSGSGFSPPVTVTFGAVAVPVAIQTSTSATVASPPGSAPGAVTVTLTSSDGQVSNGLAFAYVAGTPPPSVAGVAPASGSTLGGRTVSIAGSSFSASPAVTFGGQAAALVSASATLITVTTPAGPAGAVDVTVTNQDGQADTSPAAYTYVAPPSLATVAPASGSTGGGAQVLLGGAGFSTAAPPSVTFGGTPATVAPGHTATSLTVTSPPHGQGPVAISVINPDGQAATLAAAFTYQAPAGNAPTVESVLATATGRSTGSTAGGQPVTLAGTNFAPGATVAFGAAAATGVAFVSTTELTATTPLSQPAGPVDVTVALPGTGLAGTLVLGFTFQDPPPVVSAFNTFGSPPSGGDLMLLKGTGLHASTTVTFGGTLATVTSFTPGAAPTLDQLVVIIPQSPLLPAVADGFVDVVAHNLDGQSSRLIPRSSSDGTPWPGNFHYGVPPVASGFSPAGGKGLDVTITGTGFSADATGPRAGLQVLMSGPSFTIPVQRRCPSAADPLCLPGVTTPTAGSVLVAVPSRQLNPGSYVFVVTDFDGQTTSTPGVFVVP